MTTEKNKKCDTVLAQICGDTYDCSQIIESNTRGFTAAIGSTAHRYYELFKYSYKGKVREIIKAKTGGVLFRYTLGPKVLEFLNPQKLEPTLALFL